MQSLASGLAATEQAVRQTAAAELFEAGRRSAEAAIACWMQIPEIASLLQAPKAFITVGVAVRRELFSQIHSANGAPPLASVPPDQDVEEFELCFDPGVSLDILTTKQPGGPGAIARYLSRFGEGIQQVEFRCGNVDRATEILRAEFDVVAVYPRARPGANGTRINFFLVGVPEGGKILVELYEPATGE